MWRNFVNKMSRCNYSRSRSLWCRKHYTVTTNTKFYKYFETRLPCRWKQITYEHDAHIHDIWTLPRHSKDVPAHQKWMFQVKAFKIWSSNRTHKHIFCSCDLDLDSVTLIYEHNLDTLKNNQSVSQSGSVSQSINQSINQWFFIDKQTNHR